MGYHEADPYFILLMKESPEVTNGFKPKLLPATIQSCGLQACPFTPLYLLCS